MNIRAVGHLGKFLVDIHDIEELHDSLALRRLGKQLSIAAGLTLGWQLGLRTGKARSLSSEWYPGGGKPWPIDR